MFYNNLELRIKLADIANYILPGQLGLTGFYDINVFGWINSKATSGTRELAVFILPRLNWQYYSLQWAIPGKAGIPISPWQ